MRIACVRIPCFTVAVERRANPQLEEQPLVVYDRSGVLDASPEATGVQRGLPLRQAKALCPTAIFAQANVSLYRDVAEAMLDAIEEVSPQVEEAEAGAAYADVGGLDGHYENEFALAGSLIEAVRQATGLLAAAGVAEGKFASWVAASMTTPGDAGIVPSGKEQEFLRDKPVTFLPAELETLQRLDLLALTTLGDVATLPQTAVEAQFRSPRLWELANGIDRDALRPRKRQEILRERLSFDAPVAVSEALVLASKQLLRRLVRRLRGRTARRMHIQLLADERIVWEKLETFREPTSDERLIMLVIKTRLSLLELPQAIDTVAISLTGIGRETAKQTKLFTDTKNLNQIADAIKQLQARYGRPMIWRVKEVDPSSRHPEERIALLPYDV
ncbi:MAG: DNA polymerase Y family protein [Chloroflexi bacterium]|nr:DNA polymerase Y family protein [Chloroflexota bacterium]